MLSIILSLGCAILILYKLYSVLGYHDDENNRDHNIKDITNSAEAEKVITEIKNINYDESIEDLDKLDQDSQFALEEIQRKIPGFTINKLIQFCDDSYSNLLKMINQKDINASKDFVNEALYQKLERFIENNKSNLSINLIKINKIEIKNLAIENNHAIINVIVNSMQQITKKDSLSVQNQTGKSELKLIYALNIPNSSWIIVEISDQNLDSL